MRAPLDRLKGDLAGASGVVVGAARTMERAMGTFGASIAGTITSMSTFRSIAASALGAAGIGLLVRNAINLGDELGEMAIRTGLSTTRLQELQHAASTAGVSTENLEQALKFLNDRIAAAAGGDQAARELFASLGVAITTGKKVRDLGAIVDDLADSFQRSTSPTRDVQVALDLMSRSGTRLIPLLKQGSGGIVELSAEANRLGNVLEPRLLGAANSAGDSIQTLANTIQKNLARAFLELAPVIAEFASKLANLAAVIGPLLQTILSPERAGTNELQRRLTSLQDELGRAQAAAMGAQALGDSLNRLFGHDVEGRRNANVARIQGEIQKIEELIKKRQEADAAVTVTPPLATLPALSSAQRGAVEEAKRILESLNPSIDAADRKVLELASRFDSLAKAAGNAGPEVLRLGQQAQDLALKVGQMEEFNKIVEVFEKSLPTFDQEGRALAELGKQFDDAASKAGPFREMILGLRDNLFEQVRAFQATKIEIAGIAAAYEQSEDAARAFAEFERSLLQPFEDFDEAVRQHQVQIEALARSTGALQGAGVGGGETFGQQLEQSLQQQIRTVAQFRAEFNAMLQGVEPGSGRFDELTAAIDRADQQLIELGGRLRALTEENRVAQLSKDFTVIDANVALFGEHLEGITQKIARNRQEINLLLESAVSRDDARIQALVRQNELLTTQGKIVEFVSDVVGSTMTIAFDTVVDAFARGEQAAIKWGDVVQDILNDIIKTLFQVLVVETAIKAIRGIASSAFGRGADVGGLMAGGIVTKPTLTLVAEGGRPEAVIPLDKLRNMGGSGEVTINIHPPAGTESNAQERTDSKGNRTIDVFIIKTVQKGLGQGAFDRELGGSFGLARQGARR